MIYLVHHADAVGPEVEPQRPLSIGGRMHADALAARAAERGVRPIAIWHSGKLRARQTGEAFWRTCNPLAEFSAVRGLQPSDAPGPIRDRLIGETRDVMLVGHMPSLPRILQLLQSGVDDGGTAFPLHGLVALEPEADGWREHWRLI